MSICAGCGLVPCSCRSGSWSARRVEPPVMFSCVCGVCAYCKVRQGVLGIPVPKTPAQQGWECPKCLQVFAPIVMKCDKCGKS
jgi:hypothetical protein